MVAFFVPTPVGMAHGRELVFLASDSDNDHSAVTPGSAAAGDIAFFWHFADFDGTVDNTKDPSGYTFLFGTGNTSGRGGCFSYRILTGGEGAVTGYSSGSDDGACVLAVFRPNFTISTVTIQDADSENTSGNPSPDTITSGSGAVPLIVFSGVGANGTSNVGLTTQTPSMDDVIEVFDTNTAVLGYKIYNEGMTPVNHTVDTGDNGGVNTFMSCYVEIG